MTLMEFDGHILTDDEIEACRAVLKDIREKKELTQRIQIAKSAISFEIEEAICQIGLEETKKILRELNRKLKTY